MAFAKGKQELCKTDLKYFKSVQFIERSSLLDRYGPLENIVNQNIDPTYRHFLAQPVRENEESITWFSIPYRESPQHLSDLQGGDFEKYRAIKEKTRAHYEKVIKSLKLSGGDDSIKADFLEKATKFDDDRCVYCFDDKVVLGVWGMQMRESLEKPIYEVMIDSFEPPPPSPPPPRPVIDEPPVMEIEPPTGGSTVPPPPPPPPPPIPWYKRFWNWLTGLFLWRGCLKWLLWLLLLPLLLWLLLSLLKTCDSGHRPPRPIPSPIHDKPWVREHPDAGGIYHPGDPYMPVPTPADPNLGYGDVLPPHQGVLPSLDDPDIIREPGMPSIVANRLNILMENNDKSIMDLAKDFKQQYPDDKYKVVYYDDLVRRMQIEIPPQERMALKQEIPGKFAPEYELFVFDEALFETQSQYIPNDPAFNDPEKSWYLHVVKAPQAWNITLGSKQLTVAIVDNGFNLNHPELKNKVVMPYSVWNHSKEMIPQAIDHGTHVAGIALAAADNGKGLCGIAPNCAFMPVQVANVQGIMTTTSILDGILYALYQGADVVNVSLGSDFSGFDAIPETWQRELFRNRFKEEERLWNQIAKIAEKHNSTIVVAAGNDNVLAGIEPIQRPKNIITVSALNKQNQPYSKADFSNYGEYSTVSAPGVEIYSSLGNDFAARDGTSMAAPIVSGGIALMKSLNKPLTTEQIICILQKSGLAAEGNVGKLIQLDKALEMVNLGENCETELLTPSSGDVQITLSWNNYNDLDLICTDPKGATVYFENPKVPSGGQLEIDMNVDYPDSKNPIENIYWPMGGAPNGTYNIYLNYYQKHEPHIDATPYTVTAKYGGKTEQFQGIIKEADGIVHIASFTLGEASNSSNPNVGDFDSRTQDLLKEKRRLEQELKGVEAELKRLGNQDRNVEK